jgi:SAM-dependent methyltransferase
MSHSLETPAHLPAWAIDVLACPKCATRLTLHDAGVRCERCRTTGRIEDGILRFGVPPEDPSIAWYVNKGGSTIRQRAQVPYTMMSLDTPLYHSYLERLRFDDLEGLVVDVGAGDGRNTELWLGWGYRRVIALDATFSSLQRLRERIEASCPDRLDHLLLVECDVRHMPIRSRAASLVLAVEVLYYLNEEFSLGLAECARLLGPSGTLFLSERTREGGYLTRLLYGGVRGLLDMHASGEFYDGAENNPVRSRCFLEDELVALVDGVGLEVLQIKGMPVMSLLLSYLRSEGKLAGNDVELLPGVIELLQALGAEGTMRRTHVLVAGRRVGGNQDRSH